MYYNLCFSGVTFYCFLYHPNLVSMPLIIMNGAEKFFFCLTERGDSSGTTLRTNYFLGQSIVSVHRIENEAYAVSWWNPLLIEDHVILRVDCRELLTLWYQRISLMFSTLVIDIESQEDAIKSIWQFDIWYLISKHFVWIYINSTRVNLVTVSLRCAIDLYLPQEFLNCWPSSYLNKQRTVLINLLEPLPRSIPTLRVWNVFFSQPCFKYGSLGLLENLFLSSSEHWLQLVHWHILWHGMGPKINLHRINELLC